MAPTGGLAGYPMTGNPPGEGARWLEGRLPRSPGPPPRCVTSAPVGVTVIVARPDEPRQGRKSRPKVPSARPLCPVRFRRGAIGKEHEHLEFMAADEQEREGAPRTRAAIPAPGARLRRGRGRHLRRAHG